MKAFKEADVHDLLSRISTGETSFSRLVEILNEQANQYAVNVAQNALSRAANRVKDTRDISGIIRTTPIEV